MKASSKKTVWKVVGIIFIILFITSAVLLLLNIKGCEGDISKLKNPDGTSAATESAPSDSTAPDESASESEGTGTEEAVTTSNDPIATGERPSDISTEHAVDFDAMAEINGDIHAWIKIPGTPIDYPILQSDESDLYYERRSYTGAYSVSGCIFTQFYNHKDFSDRNTIVYGHYMMDGTFFGSLHNYKVYDFFEQNRYIYVTIPGHVLVYDIFAAYEYDNRHILAAFDFSDDTEYARYLESCLNPSTMVRNVRPGTELTTEDKIITLSTCTSYTDTSKRYLVQGVLIADVET